MSFVQIIEAFSTGRGIGGRIHKWEVERWGRSAPTSSTPLDGCWVLKLLPSSECSRLTSNNGLTKRVEQPAQLRLMMKPNCCFVSLTELPIATLRVRRRCQ